MKATKITIGILTIIASIFEWFQSSAVLLLSVLDETVNMSFGPKILGLCMLSVGILMLCTKKNVNSLVAGIISVLGVIIASTSFTTVPEFGDLVIYAYYCGILCVLNIIFYFVTKKKNKEE